MIQAWLLRQAPYIIISLALLAVGLTVGNWLIGVGREQVQPHLDRALAERDNLASTLEFERANAKKAEEAVNAYTKEIAGLRRVIRDRGPVRVCFSDAPKMPASSAASSSANDPASSAGSVSGAPRGDLAALRELAYQCDALSAQLRGLQKWASPSATTESQKSSN
jgi:hypothetical protein